MIISLFNLSTYWEQDQSIKEGNIHTSAVGLRLQLKYQFFLLTPFEKLIMTHIIYQKNSLMKFETAWDCHNFSNHDT